MEIAAKNLQEDGSALNLFKFPSKIWNGANLTPDDEFPVMFDVTYPKVAANGYCNNMSSTPNYERFELTKDSTLTLHASNSLPAYCQVVLMKLKQNTRYRLTFTRSPGSYEFRLYYLMYSSPGFVKWRKPYQYQLTYGTFSSTDIITRSYDVESGVFAFMFQNGNNGQQREFKDIRLVEMTGA